LSRSASTEAVSVATTAPVSSKEAMDDPANFACYGHSQARESVQGLGCDHRPPFGSMRA
jgi:hypothetical protein